MEEGKVERMDVEAEQDGVAESREQRERRLRRKRKIQGNLDSEEIPTKKLQKKISSENQQQPAASSQRAPVSSGTDGQRAEQANRFL